MPKGIWHDRWLVVFFTPTLCFLLLLFAVATGHHRQKWISRITLVGTANERLRHAWGTLIDKIDRLIRGTKTAGRNARLSALRRASEAFLFLRMNDQKRRGLLALTSLMKTGPGLEGLLAYPGWRKATTTHRPRFSVETGGWMTMC